MNPSNTSKVSAKLASFPFMIAPMVGLSHAAFRELIRSYTPEGLTPLIFSEMLSSLRLPSERIEFSDELRTTANDQDSLVLQIIANDEWYIERGVAKVLALSPWGIDINMGCSVRTTLHRPWGGKLMDDPEFAGEVVKIFKRHAPELPISVKTRSGTSSHDLAFLDRFTGKLEDAGADFITIHARTSAQKHRGDPNFKTLAEVKKLRKIPIIANGDIQTAEDALKIVHHYQLNGAMIGRAAAARPWIFWQIAQALGFKEEPSLFRGQNPPSTPEQEGEFYLDGCLRLINFLDCHMSEAKRLKKFRFYVLYSHRWYMFGHDFYSRCMKAQTVDDLRKTITQYKDSVTSFPSFDRINL